MDTPTYPPPPPSSAPGPTWNASKASFGQRLGAYLIDVIIVGVVNAILLVALKNVGYAIGIAVTIAYFGYFEGGETGQTLGKRVLGIRVVDVRSGGVIGYGRGVVRTIGRYISGIVCALGYLWMLWDGEKQTWHDKIASSYVVRT
jgi:uncharacterized RDD family membrane protein YckC